jgi:hypothetical protein
MAERDLEEAIDRLYAVPLEEFVAERTRLAKELRSGGGRSEAAEVAKLPKPTAAAWALNHVARERRDAVGEWLDAAAELREASTHAAEVGGDAVRAAMAANRAATTRLLGLVRESAKPGGRPLSEAMLERVRRLLQSATTDAELADCLRAGRIMEEEPATDVVPGFEVEAEPAAERRRAEPRAKGRGAESRAEGRGAEGRGAEPRAERPSREERARAAEREREAERERRAERARREELERRVRATSRQLDRLRADAARREAAAQAADERLEDARRTLHRRESEAAAARDAVKDAEEAAAAAERELQQLRTLARRAGG